MLAVALLVFLQAGTLDKQVSSVVDRITRLAASEPVEFGIDTRLKLAAALAPKYPAKALGQLRDAEAALPGVNDRQDRNALRTNLVQALAPLDFDEAERLAETIEPDRARDSRAEAYDLLYTQLGGRDRMAFLRKALASGAFRLDCAARNLAELKTTSPEDARTLFFAIVSAFPEKPDRKDIEYLRDRVKHASGLDGEAEARALTLVLTAEEALPAVPAVKKEEDQSRKQDTDVSKLSYADALERASHIEDLGDRAGALIDLSRREDLTPKQQARVAYEALSAVQKMPLSEGRLMGFSMLSRDFATRHEYASAALAAQLLLETYTKVCECGGAHCTVRTETFSCVELIGDYAEYLDEMHITQQSLGLKNLSLDARMLIYDLKKLLSKPSL